MVLAMLVLVTGAAGALGRALVPRLVGAGCEVRALDRPSPGLARLARERGVRALEGDVRDAGLLGQALEGARAVVHLAALVPPLTERSPSLAEDVNVGATLTLVRLAERRPERPRLVYPSSVVVFGPSAPEPAPAPKGAGDLVLATDRYSAHKLACEALLRDASLPSIALRLGVVLRPLDQKVSTASLGAMLRVHPDTPIELVHPDDAADALLAAACLGGDERHVVAVGGGPGLRVRHRDLWAMLLGAAGLEAPPDALFGREPYYTSWLSDEGHRLLGHATRGREALLATWRHDLARARPFAPLARPLVRAALGLVPLGGRAAGGA